MIDPFYLGYVKLRCTHSKCNLYFLSHPTDHEEFCFTCQDQIEHKQFYQQFLVRVQLKSPIKIYNRYIQSVTDCRYRPEIRSVFSRSSGF
jgi:hypothetical protein